MNKILIANRGEIAVRIIRACHELGLQTVAIYSEGDKDALHTQIADEAYCVGPTQSKDSYLNIANILSIATSTGCDGVHPGYGFLAENGDFAELCEACQLQFIGPNYESIQKMGIKDIAKFYKEFELLIPKVYFEQEEKAEINEQKNKKKY